MHFRGPKAARIYEETRKNLYPDEADSVEVVVLRNGFQGFQAQFKVGLFQHLLPVAKC